MADIEAIRRRAVAATPGPWHDDHGEYGCVIQGDYGWITPRNGPAYDEDSEQGKADAEFVAHARQDIPDLLAALDRVAAVCDAAEHQATRWEDPLPVPEWVGQVRAALAGNAEEQADG